jgi:hypothetical protein
MLSLCSGHYGITKKGHKPVERENEKALPKLMLRKGLIRNIQVKNLGWGSRMGEVVKKRTVRTIISLSCSLFIYFLFLYLFICVYIIWATSPSCHPLPFPAALPPCPHTSRQNLFCPLVLQFC